MPELAQKTVKTLPYALILSIRPREADRDALQALVGGDKVVKSYPAIAAAFDLSSNTIKQSWAPQGMPTIANGEKYSLLDVLIWRLDYVDKQETRRSFSTLSGDQIKRQLAEAELRKLSGQADRIEREEEEARGLLINRHDVVSALKSYLAALAEHLEGLPDELAPMLPLELAGTLTEELRTAIRRYLEQFRSLSAREITKKQPNED